MGAGVEEGLRGCEAAAQQGDGRAGVEGLVLVDGQGRVSGGGGGQVILLCRYVAVCVGARCPHEKRFCLAHQMQGASPLPLCQVIVSRYAATRTDPPESSRMSPAEGW